MPPISNIVPRLRSALFVPGHRRDFLNKVAAIETDAVILDLEDAVPVDRRGDAWNEVARWISQQHAQSPAVCIRVNSPEQGCLEQDLFAGVSASVTAILIPKVQTVRHVKQVEEALARHEARVGLEPLTIRLWPLLETPCAVREAYEIATSSKRIAYMGVGGSANGDLARQMGFQFSGSFLETLYVRSKVLLDVRAAGVPNPMAGTISTIKDMELVERYARFVRNLGYDGMMAVHPAQVKIINEVFGPTEAQVASARALVEAMTKAQLDGRGAIAHDGRMVDAAHLQSAYKIIAEADQFEKRRLAARQTRTDPG